MSTEAPDVVDAADIELDILSYFDVGNPATLPTRTNPHDLFDRLRSISPWYLTSMGVWLVTGHEQYLEIAREGRFSNDPRNASDGPMACKPERAEDASRPVLELADPILLMNDPPVHTRLRRLVSRAFTPRAVEKRRPRVRQIADALVDDLRAEDEFDFLRDFALLLPLRVISEMLGVETERIDDFTRWGEMIQGLAQPGNRANAEYLDASDPVAREAIDFFSAIIDARRADPGDDIISLLLEAEADEDTEVTTEEVVSLVVTLHTAGYDLTAASMASAMNLLIANPDQHSILRSDPSLIDSMFEETLRYEPPPRSGIPRIALAPFELPDGRVVETGATVFPFINAANRDPSVFEDPHRFDIRRSPNPHLGFGHGLHFCIGAPLARVEVHEAFAALIEPGVPDFIQAEGTPEWRDSFVVRALTSLPVRWAS